MMTKLSCARRLAGSVFDIGALEALDGVVAKEDCIRERLEGHRALRARNQLGIRNATHRQNEMVERQVGCLIVRQTDADAAAVDVDRFDVALNEAGVGEHLADGIDRMPRFKHAGGRLEEQGSHEEVVGAADEDDFDGRIVLPDLLQMHGGVHASKPAPENHDAAWC